MKAGRKVLQQEWNIHKQVHLKAGTLGATSKQHFESVPKANFVSVAFLSAQMSVRLWNETSQPGFVTQKWLISSKTLALAIFWGSARPGDHDLQKWPTILHSEVLHLWTKRLACRKSTLPNCNIGAAFSACTFCRFLKWFCRPMTFKWR